MDYLNATSTAVQAACLASLFEQWCCSSLVQLFAAGESYNRMEMAVTDEEHVGEQRA